MVLDLWVVLHLLVSLHLRVSWRLRVNLHLRINWPLRDNGTLSYAVLNRRRAKHRGLGSSVGGNERRHKSTIARTQFFVLMLFGI